MANSGHEITVTSPEHKWLDSHNVPEGAVPTVCVLLGSIAEDSSVPEFDEDGCDVVSVIRKQCEVLNPTAFFFEQVGKEWKVVPVSKIGTEHYFVDGVLAANYFHHITWCDTDDEQRAYLEEARVAVDGEFVEL